MKRVRDLKDDLLSDENPDRKTQIRRKDIEQTIRGHGSSDGRTQKTLSSSGKRRDESEGISMIREYCDFCGREILKGRKSYLDMHFWNGLQIENESEPFYMRKTVCIDCTSNLVEKTKAVFGDII